MHLVRGADVIQLLHSVANVLALNGFRFDLAGCDGCRIERRMPVAVEKVASALNLFGKVLG
jgi:hypothetical protein